MVERRIWNKPGVPTFEGLIRDVFEKPPQKLHVCQLKDHSKLFCRSAGSGMGTLCTHLSSPQCLSPTSEELGANLTGDEKGMATHASTLAWRIPWTEEPGGLQSMGSQRAGHD